MYYNVTMMNSSSNLLVHIYARLPFGQLNRIGFAWMQSHRLGRVDKSFGLGYLMVESVSVDFIAIRFVILTQWLW